jgi:hypothetical protein
MAELDNRVSITVTIADSTSTREGFGILAIVHKHQQSALSRVQTYFDLDGLVADFPLYTPVGKYAQIFFGQANTAESIKVIKQESAETVTAALTAAALVDDDWYAIGLPSKTQSEQEETAAYALAFGKLAVNTYGGADAITTATTDLGSVVKALNNNRTATWYSSTAGEEFTIDTITVAGTTATADLTTHASVPVAVGDKVGIWTSAVPALNAVWTVDTIGALSFTFTVPSGTSSDVASSDAWVNFNLIDAAIAGKMLPLDAGSQTWDIQELTGVEVDLLDATAQTNLGGKNINWFTDVAGNNVTGGLKAGGGGGKLASGRYLDVQRGADWLESNLQIDLFDIMKNSGLGYDALGIQKAESTIAIRLNDGQMPNLADIPQNDKTNRLLDGIKIYANIRGKVHNLEAALNLST